MWLWDTRGSEHVQASGHRLSLDLSTVDLSSDSSLSVQPPQPWGSRNNRNHLAPLEISSTHPLQPARPLFTLHLHRENWSQPLSPSIHASRLTKSAEWAQAAVRGSVIRHLGPQVPSSSRLEPKLFLPKPWGKMFRITEQSLSPSPTLETI